MSEEKRKQGGTPDRRPDSEADLADRKGPAQPVEVPRPQEKRRIFQNGDTDRTDADET